MALTKKQNALIHGGAVFLMDDNVVAFPKARVDGAGPRSLHVFRWAIVLLGPGFQSLDYPIVHVVPCSSSALPSTGELPLPDEELNRAPCPFDAKGVVAYTNLVQPCLKTDLVKYMGDLLPATYGQICGKVAQVQGLVNAIRMATHGVTVSPGGLSLPPRVSAVAAAAGQTLPSVVSVSASETDEK